MMHREIGRLTVGRQLVARRSPRVPITPEGDVFSLASVALFCLTGRSAWAADDPADVLVQSAIGQLPDPPDDAGPAELIDLVRDMLRLKPAGRPSADELSERLARCGEPTPIVFSSGADTDSGFGGSMARVERHPVSRGACRRRCFR